MKKETLCKYRIWFITGSQHLYGEETLRQVAEHSRRIVDSLNRSGEIALEIAESLEQLRWLQNGYKIKVGHTDIETIGIDTPNDLARAEAFLAEHGE